MDQHAGHQLAEEYGASITQGTCSWVQVHTNQLPRSCDRPRYLELNLPRQWFSWQVCWCLLFGSQILSLKDAKAYTSILRMLPFHHTGKQSHPTSQWSMARKIIECTFSFNSYNDKSVTEIFHYFVDLKT